MLDNNPSGAFWQKAGAHSATPQDLRRISDWLFALLRFAFTREQTDRASVMAVAQDMDQRNLFFFRVQFSFFARTSATFCDDVAARNDPEKRASLRRFIEKIDDNRLRRAFEAVLQIDRLRPSSHKLPRYDRKDLFRGLPPSRTPLAELPLRKVP